MKQPTQLGKALIGFLSLLLAVFMTVEAAHTHPTITSDGNASPQCQICATAHVAIAGQPAWLTGYVLHLIGTVTLGEPTRGSRIVVPTSFIRPPPQVEPSLA